jgi:disulfide bond formation protein DsbB
VDVLMVGFVGGFIAGGWRTGFLRRLIGLAFAVIALLAGAYFRYPVGAIASTFFKSIPPEYANLVGYTIAFPAILAGLHIARRAFVRDVSVNGLTKELDRGLGALFGGLEAIVILSAAVVAVDVYYRAGGSAVAPGSAAVFKQVHDAMATSTTVGILRDTTVPITQTVLAPLLPKDLATLFSQQSPGGLPGGALPSP